MGGFFRGAPWSDDTTGKTRRAFAFVWGEVAKDPRVHTDSKKPCTEVLVKYKSQTFIICKRWGNDAVTDAMRRLRKNDTVVIFGRYDNTQYLNKDKAQKEKFHLRAEFVLAQDVATYVLELMRSPSMAQLLKMDGKYADKLESVEQNDEDDFENYQGEIQEEIFDGDEFDDLGF